ncbi:T9SS type A sorting domain-containing protein [Bernardetia sp. MNP-M8]|uniref:T9SS type A sorting domain-containing protein n=1 Tax=Bernardetia sp. MNP-M8 TaxID=3127470 RepID=UPI0030CF40AE
MKTAIFFLFFLLLFYGSTLKAQVNDNELCINASPFCANSPNPLLYAGGTDRLSAPYGIDYECLLTTPNPAWFYMNIVSAGTHTIELVSINNVDVDIAIWGPFAAGSSLETICNQLSIGTIAPVDCSYSADPTETMNFTSTARGEIWIMLITNYSNQETDITAFQSAGTGITDCSIVPCSGVIAINGEENVCNTSVSTYSISSGGTSNLVYSLSPSNAGIINASTGRVTWNSSFSGRATVSVRASYDDCADATANYAVEVSSSSPITLSASKNPLCEGETITFTTSSSSANSSTKYDFKVNGVSVQNTTSNIFTSNLLANNDRVEVTQINTGCNSVSNQITVTILPKPTVSLSASSTNLACGETEIMFTATGTNLNNANYDFQINDVSVQNSTQNIFASSSLSNNDVIKVVVDNGSCSVTSNQIRMTANSELEVILSASSLIICPNSEVTFSVATNPTLQNLNYDFKINGVSVQNSTQDTFISSSLSNNDKITVTVSSQNCQGTSNEVIIQINNDLNVNLSASKTTICQDEEIIFTADEDFENYDFRINGNSIQNSSSNIFTSNSISNSDIVSVLVNSGNCEVTSNSVSIEVVPNINVTLSATKTVLSCQDSEIIFTANPIQNATYDFRINGISVQSGTQNTLSSTSLSVVLKNNDVIDVGVNNESCEAVSNKIMLTQSQNLDVTLSASKTTLTCQDTDIIFRTSVSANLQNGNYDFRINDISVQNSFQNIFSSASLSEALKSNDKITVIVTNGSCSQTSNEIVITFTETLNVELLASKITIEEGENIVFTANSDIENLNYDFRINDVSVQNGNSSVFNSNSISTPLKTNDVVTVIIRKGSCSAESNEVIITIESKTTGIYPNPTPDKIIYNLTSESKGAYTIRVFDAIGKSIWQEEKQKEDTFLKGTLNLESFAKGIYIIEFTDENETRFFKIIKE